MPGFSSRDFIAPQALTSFWGADDTPRHQDGIIVKADDSGWWGAGGEFIYVRAGGSIRQFGLCVWTPAFNPTLGRYEYVATECPNTANLGRPVGVAMSSAPANHYLWLQVRGITPVNSTASVAADSTFGIAAVGQAGANSAGRQILNARSVAPATTTVVRNGVAPAGSTILRVNSAEGWFPGIYLSGTGIATGTSVARIDVNNNTVVLSAATTGAVNGNVTGTYNNGTIFYNVVALNVPFAQGAIT